MAKTNADDVIKYFNKTESKFGYGTILGGTKHWGYYTPRDSMWNFNRAMRQMESLLVKKLDVESGSRILDAGCGMGDVSRFVALHADSNVIGIDLLDFNIDEAESRACHDGLSSKLTYKQMDFHELEFDECTFDAIYTMETLVHAADSEKVLSEFYRVLKPGGKLVNFEYERDTDEKMGMKVAKVYETVNKFTAMPSFQKWTPNVFPSELKQAGFITDAEYMDRKNPDDITSKIAPMVKAFSILGKLPYEYCKLIGKPEKAINCMSAVEFYKYRKREHFRYLIYVSRKPE